MEEREPAPPLVVPAVSEIDPVESSSNLACSDLIRKALSADVARLLRHDPVIRLGEDSEGVHQARVATRRLRSTLRSFAAFFDEEWAHSLRSELLWLGSSLGKARDADVLSMRLGSRISDLPEADSEAGARIVASLEEMRESELARVISDLDSERYVRLLGDLVEAANKPHLSLAADLPAASMLPLVNRTWESLRNRAESSGQPPSNADLHRIRIHAKRVRYAAETLEPFAGKPARKFIAALEQVQTELGELHDSVVAESWLRTWGAVQPNASAAFAAGAIAEAERAAALRHRSRWERAWRRLDSKPLRSWM